jgi:hypothetical protein
LDANFSDAPTASISKPRLNTKKKGQRKELFAQKVLESEGWTVGFKSHTIKLGPIFKGYDFFDLFDVVAVREKEWKLVSVKHYSTAQTKYPDHQDKIREFALLHGIFPSMSFELWLWHKPAWRGRGKNKKWIEAHFEKLKID